MTRILICIAIILTLASVSKAERRNSDYFISGGLALNGNIYSSSFNRLPNTTNDNVLFSGAFGLGMGVYAGGEYITKSGLWGRELRLGARISYSDLSAGFKETEDLANIIIGNTYSVAKVDHIITPSVTALVFEPVAVIYPFADMPLGISASLQVGLPLNPRFTQKEQIVSPPNIRYKETNSDTRNIVSGSLPETGMLFSIAVGARYEAYKFGNFTLNPEFKFAYSLNNVVQSINWKIINLSAGVTVLYNIPMPEYIQPKTPPPPPMPAPPLQSKLDLALSVTAGDREIKNGETLIMPVHEVLTYNKHLLIPTVFFKPNTADIVPLNKSGIRTEEIAQGYSMKASSGYLYNNPKVSLTIVSSAVDDEDNAIVEQRIDKTVNEFISNGISKDRIAVDKSLKHRSALNYNDLKEDYSYLRFEFSDKQKVLSYYADSARKVSYGSIDLQIKPLLSSEDKSAKFQGNITESGKTLKSFNETGTGYEINGEFIGNKSFDITAAVSGTDGTVKSANLSFVVEPKIQQQEVYENLITDIDDENRVRQYSLCFFEFDKTEFYSINYDAVEEIKKAIRNGQILEIIPLVDNYGTNEHNDRLGMARAASALKLLGIDKKDVIITIPDKYFFSNDIPYGRMLNRAVIVRIKSKSK